MHCSFLTCYVGWATRERRVWLSLSVALLLFAVFRRSSFARAAMSNPAPDDNVSLDMSRDQWRQRVAEAKRRARQFVLEHRGRSTFDTPSMADQEQIASERVLSDDVLKRGDIVSTNKGLFVFRGRPDQERRESDFIALPPR